MPPHGHEHRRRSKVQLYVHLVWATTRRSPMLADPAVERRMHRCIQAEAERLECAVLAVNGMPDHVHLLVQMPSRLAVARLAQAVKGVSSHFANEQLGLQEKFDWQDNYGAFSVSRSHLEKVVSYVKNQKRHHTTGRLWTSLEDVDEAYDSAGL